MMTMTAFCPVASDQTCHVIGLRSQLTALVGHIRWQRET